MNKLYIKNSQLFLNKNIIFIKEGWKCLRDLDVVIIILEDVDA